MALEPQAGTLKSFLPILAILLQLVDPMEAQFSLYLDQKETLRLLGLATEIHYVKDGKVEDYPLTFVMPIPANISDLHFSWENRASTEIPYRILINVTSNQNALLEPRLSIPAGGVVPHRKEVWSVELPCSGEVSAEVDVTIVVHASMSLVSGARRRHRQVLSHTASSTGTGSSSLSTGPSSGLAASSIDGIPDIVVPLKRRKVCVQGARDVPPSASAAGKGHHHKNRQKPVVGGHPSPGMTSGGGSVDTSVDSSSLLHLDRVSVKKTDSKTEPPLLASPSDVFFIVTGSVIGAIFVTVALGLAVYWTRRKYAFGGSPPGSSVGQATAPRDCVMVSTFAGSPSKIPQPISSSSTASGAMPPSSGGSGPQVMLLPPNHHVHQQSGTEIDAGSGLLSAVTEVNMASPAGSYGLPMPAMSVTSPEPTLEESNRLLQIIPVGPRSAGASTSSGGSAVMAASQTSASSWHLLVPSGPNAVTGTFGAIPNGTDLWDRVAELRLDGSRLLIRRHEEEGNAGKIYTGVLMGSVSEPQEVTVKSLKVTVGKPYCKILLEEGLLTKGLAHPNLMPLLGVIGGRPYDKVPPSLVYPYSGGNLKRYLQRCRYNKLSALNTSHVVHMGAQVATAMAYLHRQGVVHGDVATRNCVVDSSLTVKLTDACLSRDLFPTDYHLVPGLGPVPVPIKWLPVEGMRTFAGDIWSLGVLLWELVTLAADPFPEISPLEFLAFLKSGYRLGQPESCPDPLFTLMTQCWFEIPERRLNLQTLAAYLQDLQMQLQNFI